MFRTVCGTIESMPAHAKNGLALWFFLTAGFLCAQHPTPSCADCAVWNAPQAPFRVYGNTYYVGTHGLSSILVTSPAGHVLIDGALPESARQIVGHIRALGFRIEDVKLLVNSHVHFDHAGGIAELQRLSGARVAASQWSAKVMLTGMGGRDDPQYGILRPIARVSQVEPIQDGETLHVGALAITAHATPGHTPGGTSWTWRSCEGGACLDMVYADSLSAVSADGFKFTRSRDYPGALRDFENSFALLRSVKCDILLTPHPDFSSLWSRLDARQKGVTPDPMIAPEACRELADHAAEQLQQRIKSEGAP